jgi:hypothetical protein
MVSSQKAWDYSAKSLSFKSVMPSPGPAAVKRPDPENAFHPPKVKHQKNIKAKRYSAK